MLLKCYFTNHHYPRYVLFSITIPSTSDLCYYALPYRTLSRTGSLSQCIRNLSAFGHCRSESKTDSSLEVSTWNFNEVVVDRSCAGYVIHHYPRYVLFSISQ